MVQGKLKSMSVVSYIASWPDTPPGVAELSLTEILCEPTYQSNLGAWSELGDAGEPPYITFTSGCFVGFRMD